MMGVFSCVKLERTKIKRHESAGDSTERNLDPKKISRYTVIISLVVSSNLFIIVHGKH